MYRPQGKEEPMKKTIRDRSIFAVVACIAMAAIMFFYSTQPAPVRLPQDIRDIVGQEADQSFSLYFSTLQDWYDNQTVTDNGVAFSGQEQYDEMCRPIAALDGFFAAYEQIDNEEDFMKVQEYIAPMLGFTLSYMSVLMEYGSTGSYAFDAEQWPALGNTIQSMADYYRAQ